MLIFLFYFFSYFFLVATLVATIVVTISIFCYGDVSIIVTYRVEGENDFSSSAYVTIICFIEFQ